MISKETLDEYWERTDKLVESFMRNLIRAEDAMIIGELSTIDYSTYSFIRSINLSISSAMGLMIGFWCRGSLADRDDAKASKYINEFHSLEERLATQNKLLDVLESKHTERATPP